MKRFLLPHLVCPACLPAEHRLIPAGDPERDDDIITTNLSSHYLLAGR